MYHHAPQEPITLALVGDNQYGAAVMSHIVQHIANSAHLLVLVGDLVDRVCGAFA
jgi:hypothetical protein